MNCMYCGAQAGHESTCPACGKDLSAQIKTFRISDSLYNQGLDRATIRDLSAAASLLERSLKYNKRNIAARNLLGLVYFETGEAVSALSEWVISKNLMPSDNPASDYIEAVRSDPAKLDEIHLTISRYNRALDACHDGNEDIAEIMLKKVVAANPNLIKASQLLALIYIKNRQYEKARRVLLKTVPIDNGNPTTFRFLKEIDDRTGTVTDNTVNKNSFGISGNERSLFARFKSSFKYSKKNTAETEESLSDDEDILPETADGVIIPQPRRQMTAFGGILYIILGLVLGALVFWLLVVPSVRQDVNRRANDRITQYSTVVAAQTRTIEELTSEIESYEESSANTNALLGTSSERQAQSELLFKAYEFVQAEKYEDAVDVLNSIDVTLLSSYGTSVYNSLLADVNAYLEEYYRDEGIKLYEEKEYSDAIKQLLKAYDLNPTDYDVLIYLGHSYRYSGKRLLALKYFEEVVEKFSDPEKVAYASYYIGYLEQNILTDEEIEEAVKAASQTPTPTATPTPTPTPTPTATPTPTPEASPETEEEASPERGGVAEGDGEVSDDNETEEENTEEAD